MESSGHCDERFAAVKTAFEANFAGGSEDGASLAVTVDGEPVVDVWGGVTGTDADDEQPWERDTIVNVWSTTKTMTALCCLMLADRGELDFDAPVADVWPEFAAGGKAAVTTNHVLSHSAGLPGWAEPISQEDLYDWDKATSVLAAQEPWWEPGSVSGYHAVTQGYLLGEIVRRVAGTTLGTFFDKEVAQQLGADFHIGTTADHDGRVGHVVPPSPEGEGFGNASETAVRALSNPTLDASAANTIPWRRAEIPAAGGFGNARAVARVHSAVACGGTVDGITLLSPKGCDRIFDEQIYGQDLILPAVLRLGSGFGLVSPELPVGPNPRTCFWGGWGGSLAVIDLDARMSFCYVMNRMSGGTMGDLRAAGPLMATHAALATAA